MLIIVFALVLKLSLTGGIFGLTVLLIRAIFKNKIPKVCLLFLWGLVFLRLLLPFDIPSRISVFNLLDYKTNISDSGPVLSGSGTVSNNSDNVTQQNTNTDSLKQNDQQVIVTPSYGHKIMQWIKKIITEPTAQFQNEMEAGYWTLISLIWLIGILFLLAFAIAAYSVNRWRFRNAKPVQVLNGSITCYRTHFIRTPGVFGIFSPKILFPANFNFNDETAVHNILAHEIEHIRHKDNFIDAILFIALCIHWFNPLVWVFKDILSSDIESARDENVIRHLDTQGRKAYMNSLIDVAAYNNRFSFGLTKDFGKTAVKRRLVQIMKYKRISIVSIVAVIVLSSIVVAGCATGVAKNAKVQNQSSSTINSSSNNTIPSSSRSLEKTNSVSDSGGNSSTKASSSSSSSTTSASYQQYANPRFGFSVDYPSDLIAKESSDNGDGQTFASSDGSVEFEVSGVNNAESLTPAQYLKQIVLPSLKNVTYQSQNSNWYIVSWTDGNTIGYEKGIVGGKSINTYSIKYPLSRKADFDSVIQHINNSFKTPGISDYH